MFRTADPNNKVHIAALAKNINVISDILQVGTIPEDGHIDEAVQQAFNYFVDNRKLFIQHGISEHINAKKLESMTSSAFTAEEHAPTIDEMKALEVDIGELYRDESTSQVQG